MVCVTTCLPGAKLKNLPTAVRGASRLRSKQAAVMLAAFLTACVRTPPPVVAPPPPPAAAPTVPSGVQYLYGSGEGAAAALQTWRAIVGHAAKQATLPTSDSVILAPGSTLADPVWEPCGTKPRAVVFDVDETVLLNIGFEYDYEAHPGRPYSDAQWDAWERTGGDKVAPTPGAAKALAVLRNIGVTVVFNTNRSAANAAQTQAAIEGAGLGPAVHGDTLFLQGDDATGNKKDGRRAMIAAKYCVIAMAGDQLGDFSDLFNAGQKSGERRAAVLAPPLSAKFGAGWFLMPNPAYGTALKGSIDEIFPADKRWAMPRTDK